MKYLSNQLISKYDNENIIVLQKTQNKPGFSEENDTNSNVEYSILKQYKVDMLNMRKLVKKEDCFWNSVYYKGYQK